MSSLVKSSERLLISTKKAKGSNKELHMSKPADDADSTLHISSASASAPVPDPSTSHSLSQVIVPDADDIFSHEANESDENSTNNNYSLNITVRVAENNDSIHYHGEEGIKSNGGASREACERNNTMPGSITQFTVSTKIRRVQGEMHLPSRAGVSALRHSRPCTIASGCLFRSLPDDGLFEGIVEGLRLDRMDHSR
ncbi:hypothetical protein WAI453_006062 [Rhynchosporium graminicola]